MSLVSAIPETIKEIGRAKAAGLGAKGQYGQSIADIGQMVGRIPQQMAADRRQKQQDQITTLRLTEAQRAAEADRIIQAATGAALRPDGTLDEAKLAQHLAGTSAVSALPDIVGRFQAVEAGRANLQKARGAAQDVEDDELGKFAAMASVASDPSDQAALLVTGIASGVKAGTISQQRAQTVTAQLMGEDGAPDPQKVADAIKEYQRGSTQQRQLAATDATRRTAELSSEALIEQRKATAAASKAKEERAAFDAHLENLSRQLGNAKSKSEYARIYQGVPDTMRSYFDAPESFDPKTSVERAREVLLTPAERETRRHNRATEDANAAVRAEQQRHNKAMERKGSGEGDDKTWKQDFDEYKTWVGQWEQQQKTKLPPVDDEGEELLDHDDKPIPAPYSPPPSFEDWRRLGKGARVGLGQTGDVDLPASGQKATPATPATVAPGSAGVVTQQQLEAVAKMRNTTVDVQRKRAIAEGFTVK